MINLLHEIWDKLNCKLLSLSNRSQTGYHDTIYAVYLLPNKSGNT